MAHCTRPTTTPAPAAGEGSARNYVDPDELRTMIRRFKRTKRVDDQLARALLAIARGVWGRYQYTADADDFAQDCYLHLTAPAGPLTGCSPNGNPFAFITQAIRWYGGKLREKEQTRRARFRPYSDELLDADPRLAGHLHTRMTAEDLDEWTPTTDEDHQYTPDVESESMP